MKRRHVIQIIESGIKQKIVEDMEISQYQIIIKNKKVKIVKHLKNKVDETWKKFKKANPNIAQDNTTYFFIPNKGKNYDLVIPERFRFVQAFGKTAEFKKYEFYFTALSSLCLVWTSDNKLVFGIKENMAKKISGFSGYSLKIDVRNNKIDIYKYLIRTAKEELNIDNDQIDEIKRIGKTYSPNIVDIKGKINNRVYNNNFLIKLNINSKKLKKNFKSSSQFKKIFILKSGELIPFVKKNYGNFSIHCIGALYNLLVNEENGELLKKFLKVIPSDLIIKKSKKKTILITGASGFIGEYLSRKFSKNYDVIGIDIVANKKQFFYKFYKANIKDNNKLKEIFQKNPIDYVIHSAAAKHLIWCETHKNESYEINFKSTKSLYNFAKEKGAKFLFLSSDQVFDGKEKRYSENSNKHPINYYGALKDLCEEFLIKDSTVAICRTAMVFGEIPKNQKKFFNKIKKEDHLVVQGYIIGHVLYRLRNHKRILLSKNEFCNPTGVNLLYRQLKIIIKKNISGILHCSGEERISRYDFGKRIAKFFNFNTSFIDFPSSNNFLRPKDVSFNVISTQKKLGFKFDNINQMIRQTVEE